MKRKKVTPFEDFLEKSGPGVEHILSLLEADGVLLFNQQQGEVKTLQGRYNLSFIAPVPKKTILRIDSTEDTFLLDQTKVPGSNLFTVFNVGDQVPFIEYRGFSESDTITLLQTGEIVFPQVCKFRENGELKDAMGYFVILELPLTEKGSTKTYDELYRPERVYTFFDLLEDILKAETWRIVSDKRGEVPPAKVSGETRRAIKDFLQPFYEEEQLEIEDAEKLDLQMFNGLPASLTQYQTPDKTYVALSKPARSQATIYTDTLEKQFSIIDVGDKSKEHVDVLTSIQCEAGPPAPLEKYLQDSIGSIMENSGVEEGATFSLDQIAREFLVLPAGAKITTKTRGEIEASIDKQRSSKVTIDFRQQKEKHNKTSVINAKLEGNMIEAQKLTVKAGGSETVAYRFLTLPIYYKYSKEVQQITGIDRKMLSTEKARYSNIEFSIIKRAMLQSIETMKEKKKKNQSWTNKCSYDPIIKEVYAESLTEKQARTIKKAIHEYAEILVEKGYITAFKPYKNRGSRAFNGIEIIL